MNEVSYIGIVSGPASGCEPVYAADYKRRVVVPCIDCERPEIECSCEDRDRCSCGVPSTVCPCKYADECEKCAQAEGNLHPCPYSEEMSDEEGGVCDCCEDCTDECALAV